MSLIEKKNLNYLTMVAQFFLSLKGSGWSLSASDYHLIGQWETRGVPMQALCRAIESGYQQARQQSRTRTPNFKTSLSRMATLIDQEIEKAER